MFKRPLLLTLLLAALFTTLATSTQAQVTCPTPSGNVTGAIDTILYVNGGDTPLMVIANLADGTHPSTIFSSNGTGQIYFAGTTQLESATVNGTTVCHGFIGSTMLPSGSNATIEVGTSPTSGRPYIKVTVDELE